MKSKSSKYIVILIVFISVSTLTLLAIHNKQVKTSNHEAGPLSKSDIPRGVQFPKDYIAHHFDYPVGTADGHGYYNAQGFADNDHLGDDWNGIGGGNTDFGDPIYAIANGRVKAAEDYGGGWGGYSCSSPGGWSHGSGNSGCSGCSGNSGYSGGSFGSMGS